MGDAIITGLAMGVGPREIARNIRLDLAGNLNRALRIARTEIVRASREASREIYKANEDVVGGYMRRSARSERTCAACWAMDGEVYSLDTPLDDHPNGLCYMVPYLPDAADMYNLDDTGVNAFEKLSEEQKRAILGPVKYEGYKQGLFGLKDLVGHTNSEEWGGMLVEKSLKSLLGEEKAKELVTEVLHGENGSGVEKGINQKDFKNGLEFGEATEIIVSGVRVTQERVQHWRDRHPEVKREMEENLINRAIDHPDYVIKSNKDKNTLLNYVIDDDNRWWVVVVNYPEDSDPFIVTIRRAREKGK